MKYWYFKFEGVFTQKSENYGNGVFSGCVVPESNFQKAKKLFYFTLRSKHIECIDLAEYFSINGDELDPTDEVNSFWIEFYQKAKQSLQPVCDVWHLYKLGT